MATINDNNLPNGVRPGPVSGLYLITNSKGQTSRVNADNIEQLNTYNNSWQTGKPATVTRDMPDGSTRQVVYNPSNIIGQQQATTEYQANLAALKRADVLPNNDGTYSSRTTGAVLTDAELQQKVAAAGLPPNTLEIQKNNGKFIPTPTPASVEASTAAVNDVTNTPSSLQPAPADQLTGTVNSPLTVDSKLGATIVKEEPNLAQNAAATPPITQRQVEDADPEGNANVAGQNAAANQAAIQNGQEGVNLNPSGITTGKTAALNSGQDFKPVPDWRVRLSLAPGANYLYKVGSGAAGILNPLQATEGVIFPYTPAISVAYAANYTPFDPTHSNYKIYQYTNSSVDSFSITCDFTAQDTTEANYLLAVIHFFKSITKMFYGQDQNPKPGTPPPLCYLTGLGEFQFDNHPLAITGFTYQLPTDVDYIRALPQSATSGAGQATSPSGARGISNGIFNTSPKFSSVSSTASKPTYVPTKMQISITAHPIVSRNNISNKFSLKEYATGQLLLGKSRSSGGIW